MAPVSGLGGIHYRNRGGTNSRIKWYHKTGIINGKKSEGYDDSFSNCGNGMLNEIAEETIQRIMRDKRINKSYVTYYCKIFWIPDGSEGARQILNWKNGLNGGISMASQLKASYTAFITENGISREYKVCYVLDKSIEEECE